MLGRIVYMQNSESINTGQTLEIDLAQLNPGKYCLLIVNNEDTNYFLFTKQ